MLDLKNRLNFAFLNLFLKAQVYIIRKTNKNKNISLQMRSKSLWAFFCCPLCYYPYNIYHVIYSIFIIQMRKPSDLWTCERSYHCSHLYGSNRSWMSLKDSNWCASSKTPYSHNFITAACSNESVFVVNGHVRDFSRVPAQCSKEASIICSPDFHQAVIWTLQ